jgi:penicillin-binding protein 1C
MYYTNRFPLLTNRIEREIDLFCNRKENALEKFVMELPENFCTEQNKQMTLSIDAGLMKYAQDVLRSTLDTLSKEHVSAGSIYIKNPKEEKVLAYLSVSSTKSEDTSSIDMITRERSVGSLLKPFIYLLALQK